MDPSFFAALPFEGPDDDWDQDPQDDDDSTADDCCWESACLTAADRNPSLCR